MSMSAKHRRKNKTYTSIHGYKYKEWRPEGECRRKNCIKADRQLQEEKSKQRRHTEERKGESGKEERESLSV